MWRLEQKVVPAEGKSVVFWWSRKTPGSYLGHVHFLQAAIFPFLMKPTFHSNYMYFGIFSFYQAIVSTVKNCVVHNIFKNICAKLTYLLNEAAAKWNRTRNLLNA